MSREYSEEGRTATSPNPSRASTAISRVEDEMVRVLDPLGLADDVQDEYTCGPVLTGEGLPAARYLPRALRERTYAMVAELGERKGIEVKVSLESNPDFISLQMPERRRLKVVEVMRAVGRRVMSLFA